MHFVRHPELRFPVQSMLSETITCSLGPIVLYYRKGNMFWQMMKYWLQLIQKEVLMSVIWLASKYPLPETVRQQSVRRLPHFPQVTPFRLDHRPQKAYLHRREYLVDWPPEWPLHWPPHDWPLHWNLRVMAIYWHQAEVVKTLMDVPLAMSYGPWVYPAVSFSCRLDKVSRQSWRLLIWSTIELKREFG